MVKGWYPVGYGALLHLLHSLALYTSFPNSKGEAGEKLPIGKNRRFRQRKPKAEYYISMEDKDYG
jgi:hypothetical protein